jgi:uncharacterized protein YkwD
MSAEYTEMGVAFTADAQSAAAIYWAQLFATPLP